MKSYDERRQEAEAIYQEGLRKVRETPEPIGQKFKIGTFVRIAKDLGESMFHFKSDTVARVEYTYAHAFGDYDGTKCEDYCLLVLCESGEWISIAWYEEWQLTQINDENLIAGYKSEIERTMRK